MPSGKKKNQNRSTPDTYDEDNTLEVSSSTDPVVVEKLTKQDVERLFAHESERISFENFIKTETTSGKKKGKVRSKHYLNFKRVLVDEKVVNFVSCNDCSSIFTYNTANGTSTLKRHNCKNKKNPKNENKCKKSVTCDNITGHFKKIVPDSVLHKLNDDIVAGLAKDLRPLSSVEREGFLLIAQAFINLGAKYGAQSAKDVIQHRTTLTRNRLPALCTGIEERLKVTLQSAPSYPKFSYSADMWMEKHDSSHFMSLSAHHINDNWELKKSLLGMDQFDEKKTTFNIRKDCERILGKYFGSEEEVLNVISNSVSVTDGGSNMTSVFPRRKSCQCHKLNLFVEWTLNNKDLTSTQMEKYRKNKDAIPPKKLFKLSVQCPKIEQSLTSVKELVTHFKRTLLNSELSTTLKQDVVTRWNSELISIESYLKVKDEVKKLCLRNDLLNKLSGINDNALEELKEFLQPIAESSEILSGDNYPTIHLVALFYHELQKHIEVEANDSSEMKLIKRQAAWCFEEYCVLDKFYYMAAMFDPRYKSLKFATPEVKAGAIQMLKKLVEREEKEIEEKGLVAVVTPTPTAEASAMSHKLSRFHRLMDDDQESHISEVDRYLSYKLPSTNIVDDDEKFNVLHFWRDAKDFPILRSIARWILAIPASETTEERVFSDANYIKSPRRTVLNGKHLSNLVFLCKNFEMYSSVRV